MQQDRIPAASTLWFGKAMAVDVIFVDAMIVDPIAMDSVIGCVGLSVR